MQGTPELVTVAAFQSPSIVHRKNTRSITSFSQSRFITLPYRNDNALMTDVISSVTLMLTRVHATGRAVTF